MATYMMCHAPHTNYWQFQIHPNAYTFCVTKQMFHHYNISRCTTFEVQVQIPLRLVYQARPSLNFQKSERRV